jgi:hypothetical protein
MEAQAEHILQLHNTQLKQTIEQLKQTVEGLRKAGIDQATISSEILGQAQANVGYRDVAGVQRQNSR